MAALKTYSHNTGPQDSLGTLGIHGSFMISPFLGATVKRIPHPEKRQMSINNFHKCTLGFTSTMYVFSKQAAGPDYRP